MDFSFTLSNFSRDFGVFARDLGRPASILERSNPPRRGFRRPKRWIFEVFRRAHTFGADFLRSVQNPGRTGEFWTSVLARDEAKTTKKRFASAQIKAKSRERSRTAFLGALGSSRASPGRVLGAAWAIMGGAKPPKSSPRPSQDRPKKAQEPPEQYKKPLICHFGVVLGFESLIQLIASIQ